MGDDLIILQEDGPVATLLLNRAAKKNALSLEMWRAIPGLLERLRYNTALRVLVVGSVDLSVFSAGADIAEFKQIAEDDKARRENIKAVREAQNTLAAFPLPTIARVGGACVGGGCGLALTCDIRVAGAGARFGITPANLGLVYPLEDMYRLVMAVGQQAARRLLFTAELVGADEARRLGLAGVVVPDEQLVKATDSLAATIASKSPWSLRQMKRHLGMIAHGLTQESDGTLATFLSAYDQPDFSEGLAAFMEGRKPDFSKI